jgi:tetratricopeptide (TPR) repeat protein
LRGAGIGIGILVLVASPFFRGLFFWTELLPAIALVALAFGLWVVGRRLGGLPVGVPGGVAGGALLALAGCYALQFAWAFFPRGNLDWLLRVIAGWFMFVMFRAEASAVVRRWLAWAFVVGASAVAVHGLIEFVGLRVMNPDLAKSLSLVGLSTRMYTAIQYPNTAAVYFLAALFLAIGLGVASGRTWVKGLVGGLGTLLAVAFFFTISRGAVVVVPFGLLLLFLGLERGSRWPALLLLGASLVPTMATVGPIGTAVGAKAPVVALTWIGVAVLVGIIAGGLVGLLGRLSFRRQLALVAVLAVIGSVGLGVMGAGRPLLPKQASRLFDMSLSTPNVALRLIYYRDASRMVADRPLGRGGWGWARSYRQYATFNHTARETHNHYAQTAVEAGVPGLLALVTALLAGLWGAWRNRKGNPLGWAIAAGALLIAGHSLIDFDLSYGGVWLMLWSLLGASLSGAPQGKREGAMAAGAIASALAILVTATALWQGARLSEEADRLAAEGKTAEAQAVAAKAAEWDSLNSQALIQAAEHASLLRAVQVDPTNPEAWFKLSISYELRKEWQLALSAIQKAGELDPWEVRYVDKEARLAGYLMLDDLAAGKRDEALTLADALVTLEATWTERLASAEAEQHLWSVKPGKLDPGTRLRFAQARFLKGDLAGAKPLLLEAAEVGLLNTEAEVWLYALYEKQGDTAGMKKLENQPWIRFRESNPVYKAIQKR